MRAAAGQAFQASHHHEEATVGFIATIIVGLIAGWLTGMLMKTGTSLVGDLILGVIGGFVGGWLTSLLMGVNLMSGINITSVIVAFIGAVVVVALYRLITRRSVA